MLAVALALASSVCYGVSNFLAPLQGRRHSLAAVLAVGQGAALIGTLVLLAVVHDAPPPAAAFGWAALAGLGNLVGLATFYRAAAIGPISVVAPIGAMGAIGPVSVGLIRGEDPGTLALTGIPLAMVGAVLVSMRGIAREELAARREASTAAAWAACSAAAFALFLIALPEASDDNIWWALALARATLVGGLVAGLVALRQTVTVSAGDVPMLSVPGLLLLAGTLLYVLAAGEGLLSIVSVAGSLFPVVTVALAMVVLGERVRRLQAFGMVLAVLGVMLMAAR